MQIFSDLTQEQREFAQDWLLGLLWARVDRKTLVDSAAEAKEMALREHPVLDRRRRRREYEDNKKAAAGDHISHERLPERPGLPSAEDLDAVMVERDLVAREIEKAGAVESYDMAVAGVQD